MDIKIKNMTEAGECFPFEAVFSRGSEGRNDSLDDAVLVSLNRLQRIQLMGVEFYRVDSPSQNGLSSVVFRRKGYC